MSDFTMYTGDDRSFNVGITNEEGVADEVSGATSIIYAIINPRNGVALATKDLSNGITVIASVVTVTLVPADTEGLLGGTYLHELEIITSDNKTYTALQGEIILKKGYITHE
jgi:hypothetical protein